MPTILSFLSGRQITNDSGVPQAGAKVFHYRATTTTALTVWQNAGASVAHAQPVVCDAGGFVPLVYVDDTFNWKIVVTTAAGVTLPQYNFDNIPKAESDASALGFAPPLFPWVQVTSGASPVALTVADVGKAYEADTTGGSIEFDLPSAASVGDGKGFVFKKTATPNSMILDPFGTETIDDVSTSLTITQKSQAIGIFSNGAEWYVVWHYLDDASVAVVSAVNGLTIANNAGAPTTQLDIACSEAVLLTTVGIGLRVGAQALTLNAATVGANGLDAGALANNSWYYVWLISNGATTACLLSLSATAPTMPSGYTYKYRIGAQRTGGAATFNRVLQKGNKAQYVVVTASVTPNLPLITSGTAGNTTTPTWVSVATGNFLPPTAPVLRLMVHSTGAASQRMIVAPSNAYGAYNSNSNPPVVSFDNVQGTVNTNVDLILESTNIFWASDLAANALFALGWVDAVNAN